MFSDGMYQAIIIFTALNYSLATGLAYATDPAAESLLPRESRLHGSERYSNGNTVCLIMTNMAGIAVSEGGAVFITEDRGPEKKYIARGNRPIINIDRDHRIRSLTMSGSTKSRWGTYGSHEGEFNDPSGLAIAPNGIIYVADSGNHRVQYFSVDGVFLGMWGTEGEQRGEFRYPVDVAVGRSGNVYVSDTENNRIQYFSPTGVFFGEWGSEGSSAGQFKEPYGVAVAPNGNVYVSDSGNNRIQYFNSSGSYLGAWGDLGSAQGQFKTPAGLAITKDGLVYVADRKNHRVQYFNASGSFLGSFGTYGASEGQFKAPDGITLSSAGDVYVVESDRRIQRFAKNGSFKGYLTPNEIQVSNPPKVARRHGATRYVVFALLILVLVLLSGFLLFRYRKKRI